jgi:hypothetical protein
VRGSSRIARKEIIMSLKIVRTELVLAAAAAVACAVALLPHFESATERRVKDFPEVSLPEVAPTPPQGGTATDAFVEAAKAKARQEAVSRRALDEAESVRRAHSHEIRHYLGCLLEKGFMQPVSWQDASPKFERETRDRPLSLSRLRNLGALDATREGLAHLNAIVSDAKNDRARWQFGHPLTWSADADYFVQHAQRLLVELGPTLVEEGLLAP